jgi:polar amino acid transport system substrate-binding protein
MKQVVQNYRTGELSVEDVPTPVCRSGGILVRTAFSLVSAGTERMKVEQARMSLWRMAKSRPDKVQQVLQSCKQVGVLETVAKVRERLDALTPLGYSLAGHVEEVGAGLDEFRVGDRVACAGEGMACHAEFVSVPRNLCAAVPESVDLRDAAFATVGAIALHGVRQSAVSLGDSVLVIGLGLVGQLAVQMLKAAGCVVLGVDLDPEKVRLALQAGADAAHTRDDAKLEDTIRRWTRGHGPDVVYLAAATSSTDPMELAGRVVRDRGRVVVVGMSKIEADWKVYYQKEVSVVLSRSYGPGRYDRQYEHKGIDYPIGYVRWTQRRNLEEFLRLIAAGQVKPRLLSPALFEIDQAPQAYEQLHENPGKHPVGMLFKYAADAKPERSVIVARPRTKAPPRNVVRIGLIGAGNFATGMLIPALSRLPHVERVTVCSAGGLSARSAARRHGFADCSSDYENALHDDRIDAVIIATRHDSHARISGEALRAGKHVFVEKPMALNVEQLHDVIEAHDQSSCILMPGFNRRFSPLSVRIRDHFRGRSGPLEMVCRVNAGEIAKESWYEDGDEGGWRLISEGCHFIDLMQFLAGSTIAGIHAEMVGGTLSGAQNANCTVLVRFEDGSLGTLVYVANGDPRFEKERIEVFGQGSAAVIENWRSARIFAKGRVEKLRPKGTGKGHEAELAAFIDAVRRGESSPIPFDQAVAATLATFRAAAALTAGASQSEAQMREMCIARS